MHMRRSGRASPNGDFNVPAKHIPRDRLLLLGRGSRNHLLDLLRHVEIRRVDPVTSKERFAQRLDAYANAVRGIESLARSTNSTWEDRREATQEATNLRSELLAMFAQQPAHEPCEQHKALRYFAAEAIRYVGFAEISDWNRVDGNKLADALSQVLCKLQAAYSGQPPGAVHSTPGMLLLDAYTARDASQPPPAEYDRDRYPTACLAAEAYIEQYVDGYEMFVEDAEGRDGYYQPNSQEEVLIRDAINGLHAQEEFVDLIAAEHAERQARRAAEGCCPKCGAPAGQHWGLRCSPATKGSDP